MGQSKNKPKQWQANCRGCGTPRTCTLWCVEQRSSSAGPHCNKVGHFSNVCENLECKDAQNEGNEKDKDKKQQACMIVASMGNFSNDLLNLNVFVMSNSRRIYWLPDSGAFCDAIAWTRSAQ